MSIKKAELHVHLEGTITPAWARRLAERNQLAIPEGLIAADDSHYLSRDFLHFLTVYDTLAALIKKPQDYYDITFDYLKQCALQDTIYVEMMYSPDHAEQTSGIPSIEHLQAIQQAVDDAEQHHDILGRILITGIRHYGEESCIRVVQEALKQSVPCVVGYGLGGDEIHFPPHLFKRSFQMAHEGGLHCTAHAGEFAPASGIIEAIESLPIRRVGHGVQAIHSPETIARLIDDDIALELCPTSNVKLGLFPDLANHPFPELLKSGLKVSLNSDDPPFMSTTVGREYEVVQQAYQYSDDTMKNITAMAIDCAFVDEVTKERLKARL